MVSGRYGRIALLVAMALAAAVLTAGPAQGAPRCFGKGADIVGTPENDNLRGGKGSDVILGLGGRDRISGRGGNDRVCGGDGSDRIRAQGGNDKADGGTGGDRITGAAGNDEILGGPGFDSLDGGKGNNTIKGGGGGDFLKAGGGNDNLDAGGRSDSVVPGLGDDVVSGGPGSFDLVSFINAPAGVTVDLALGTPQATGGAGSKTITGMEGVEGSFFNDVLKGQDVVSTTGNGLFGLEGVDQLLGLEGDDVLFGGFGSDEGLPVPGNLNGGAGNDQVFGDEAFLFRPALRGPSANGDDDLYGDSGDDFLDGGGNVTGPPAGDFGDGGAHIAGDTCTGVEAAIECEMFTRTELKASGAWAQARSAVAPWLRVRARRL